MKQSVILPLLTLLIAITITYCYEQDGYQSCTDGETKMKDCNMCRCMNGGWACTRINCPQPQQSQTQYYGYSGAQSIDAKPDYDYRPPFGRPNTAQSIDAKPDYDYRPPFGRPNTAQTIDAKPSYDFRPPFGRPISNDLSGNLQRKTGISCSPGQRFKDDCNWCTCTQSGNTAMCTMMACPGDFNNQFSGAGVSAQGRRSYCTPGQAFKQQCNTCICNSEGTNAACTMMGCLNDEN